MPPETIFASNSDIGFRGRCVRIRRWRGTLVAATPTMQSTLSAPTSERAATPKANKRSGSPHRKNEEHSSVLPYTLRAYEALSQIVVVRTGRFFPDTSIQFDCQARYSYICCSYIITKVNHASSLEFSCRLGSFACDCNLRLNTGQSRRLTA